ncbi:hypothetical protein B0H11DRAFT_1907185 [Mycena galericulata]|nr:hypothetical protein B0H11DRAFT_1907185 [Mycena galericulata]
MCAVLNHGGSMHSPKPILSWGALAISLVDCIRDAHHSAMVAIAFKSVVTLRQQNNERVLAVKIPMQDLYSSHLCGISKNGTTLTERFAGLIQSIALPTAKPRRAIRRSTKARSRETLCRSSGTTRRVEDRVRVGDAQGASRWMRPTRSSSLDGLGLIEEQMEAFFRKLDTGVHRGALMTTATSRRVSTSRDAARPGDEEWGEPLVGGSSSRVHQHRLAKRGSVSLKSPASPAVAYPQRKLQRKTPRRPLGARVHQRNASAAHLRGRFDFVVPRTAGVGLAELGDIVVGMARLGDLAQELLLNHPLCDPGPRGVYRWGMDTSIRWRIPEEERLEIQCGRLFICVRWLPPPAVSFIYSTRLVNISLASVFKAEWTKCSTLVPSAEAFVNYHLDRDVRFQLVNGAYEYDPVKLPSTRWMGMNLVDADLGP